MLQETVDRNKINKLITVRTGSVAFTRVLERLLTTWGFSLSHADDRSVLLLIEEGCGGPGVDQETVWLSSSHKPGQDRLDLPVKIEPLWQALEQHFHYPPRMHMRLAVDLPARVSLRGEWHKTRLSNLSDMGARFSSDRELVKQEQVIIELTIGGVLRRYHGQVIFSMATGPTDTPVFQSGVVFHKQGDALTDDLRCYLNRQFLEAVRDEMDLPIFRAGLAFFDLAPEVRRTLLEFD